MRSSWTPLSGGGDSIPKKCKKYYGAECRIYQSTTRIQLTNEEIDDIVVLPFY
ncbi:hypothetical protein [Legionella israelensis]|uniref:hypothetical protein n=1 Tax=Legionella israelensis TaxID=454 RepID=UPI0013EF95F1|nr:hypothetical protein [Legionella israelensis]